MSELAKERETLAEPKHIPPLKTHNSIKGDRAALDRAWETEGYWFFKNVLDPRAVERLRRVMVDELVKLGVVDPGEDAYSALGARHNGADLSKLYFRLRTLTEKQPWRDFVSDPSVHKVVTELLGDEPFWIPVVEYRTLGPDIDKGASRVGLIHQDGPYSRGIPFRIFWVPLTKVDEEVGGMVLAEGMTEPVNRHPPAPDGRNQPIPLKDIPPERWRQTICEPGDLLIFNQWLPHSSFGNRSDRFRLSLDQRVLARSENVPVVGTIRSISIKGVTVLDEGQETTLRFEADTYYRPEEHEGRLLDDDIVNHLKPGDHVIVGRAGDKAVSIRPSML